MITYYRVCITHTDTCFLPSNHLEGFMKHSVCLPCFELVASYLMLVLWFRQFSIHDMLNWSMVSFARHCQRQKPTTERVFCCCSSALTANGVDSHPGVPVVGGTGKMTFKAPTDHTQSILIFKETDVQGLWQRCEGYCEKLQFDLNGT